ncbi:transglutaminase-like domain-containing protein [Hamadaea tsunoensis]|uniref:transglutaminase-like domain-containing protein n=1 Tax=Hamadaea tsunoensis TaxID=53368 RepID=UPI0004889D3F|nr:transglutaminase-like domain-containing protein [Hamadaea tsunoensis]
MTTPTQLRIAAEDLLRAEDDGGLLALAHQLREDELWPSLWAPACAVAASRLGRQALARGYLDEALDGGFFQPEIFEGEVEKAFGADPAWPAIQARFAANLPPVPLLLTEWPTLTPTLPLELYRTTPDREELLRPYLPELSGSAWNRALTLLHWVTGRWEHANDHVAEEQDAVDVLRHVDDDGMRFACVEYSVVLSHALNAAGIPARRVGLRQRDYHAGWGKGHVVSEAWLDDLGKWVVLDGQNGAYWSSGDQPLSAPELQAAFTAGSPPAFVAADGPLAPDTAAFWFTYFHHIATTGATWAETFVPHFQGAPRVSRQLVRSPADVYPDLGEIGLSMDVRADTAAVRLTCRHPHFLGYAVQHDGVRHEIGAADPVWPLPTGPGEHEAALSVRTALGDLPPRRLAFRVLS